MKPIDRTHHTSDGPIWVWVYKTPYGWLGRHQGPQLDGGMVFKTLKAANAYAEESFAQMFPERRCGRRCTTSATPAVAQPMITASRTQKCR